MSESSKMTTRSYGWIVLTGLGALLTLASLGLLFAGVDTGDIQSSTGLAWETIVSETPGVAGYIQRLLALLTVIGAGFAAMGTAVSATSFRAGRRSGWTTMLLFPLVYGAIAAVFINFNASGLGAYYGGLAVLTVIVLALSARRFFRSK